MSTLGPPGITISTGTVNGTPPTPVIGLAQVQNVQPAYELINSMSNLWFLMQNTVVGLQNFVTTASTQIWNRTDGSTPQQAFAALSTNAGNFLEVVLAVASTLNVPFIPVGYALTYNPDGTVTAQLSI